MPTGKLVYECYVHDSFYKFNIFMLQCAKPVYVWPCLWKSVYLLPQDCYKTVGLNNACIANACHCSSFPACVHLKGKEIYT